MRLRHQSFSGKMEDTFHTVILKRALQAFRITQIAIHQLRAACEISMPCGEIVEDIVEKGVDFNQLIML